jgi:hypothetical protein
MRKSCICVLLLILIAAVPQAIAQSGKAGQAGAFLKFGQGARALGLGGAFCSIADDQSAIFYNPAGIAFSSGRQVAFNYHSLTLDRNLNSASIVLPVRNEAVMAASWINSSVSDVQMRDSDRNLIGEFSNSYNLFGLSFAKKITDQFAAGANIRYIQAKLDYLSAYTVGADFGGLFKPNEFLALGLALCDLGSDLRWESGNYWSSGGTSYGDKFPFRLRGGASASALKGTLIPSVDAEYIQELGMKFHGGAEYWILKKIKLMIPDEDVEDEYRETEVDKRLLGLRAGYGDGSLNFGLSIYVPIEKTQVGFDYAFVSGKRSEGSNQIFTVRIAF